MLKFYIRITSLFNVSQYEPLFREFTVEATSDGWHVVFSLQGLQTVWEASLPASGRPPVLLPFRGWLQITRISPQYHGLLKLSRKPTSPHTLHHPNSSSKPSKLATIEQNRWCCTLLASSLATVLQGPFYFPPFNLIMIVSKLHCCCWSVAVVVTIVVLYSFYFVLNFQLHTNFQTIRCMLQILL